MGITRQFLDGLSDMGIDQATEIQSMALPPALAGQDVLGIAETGSGKTLAYLLPLAMKLKYAREEHPRALIFAPSKELAQQIHAVWTGLTAYSDLRGLCLYGGVGKKNQIEALRGGQDLIVATPGRFMDLYSEGHIFLRQVDTLVLDEADRMMEMGFMPQLRGILEVIPVKRQNLLFSATFPERVEQLSTEFLEWPVKVQSRKSGQPKERLQQYRVELPNFRTKLNYLLYMLESEPASTLIFCKSRDIANRVARFLERQSALQIAQLHANKGQHTRNKALEDFRSAELQVLVSTDVSSRGIDIAHVQRVVNFDLPQRKEDYLHRVGRTARMERAGEASILHLPHELPEVESLEKALGTSIALREVPAELPLGEDLPGERQDIARAIDARKRRMDPNYQGAFHAKKRSGSKSRSNVPAKEAKSKSGAKKPGSGRRKGKG